MELAYTALFGMCVIVCIVMFFILVCNAKEEKVENANSAFGQLKIILAYLQIMASMPGVMESVPWPEMFVQFSVPFTAVNLNFMGIFAQSSCGLSLRFPQQFIVHMALPIFLVIAAIVAYVMSNICGKKEKKQHRFAQTMKIIILLILLVYPGLCTQVFTMFRCKTIPGVDDGKVLVADFSLRCAQGEHATYSILAFIFGGLYVFGIPFGIFLVLRKNRKHLYDKNSPKHADVMYSLGGLYSQYEEKFWWFELVIVLHKMFMTGALCILAPGSSAQPLVATLFQMMFLLVILKAAPYESDGDDKSSFVSALTLTLTMLCAFAVMAADPADSDAFSGEVVGYVLVIISIFCLVVQVDLVIIEADFSILKKCTPTKKPKVVGDKTKVSPMITDSSDMNSVDKAAQMRKENAEKAWAVQDPSTETLEL